MANIHGYTQDQVIRQQPKEVRGELAPQVRKLDEMGLGGTQSGGKPPKAHIISGDDVRLNLKRELGMKSGKRDAVMGMVSTEALKGGLNVKLEKRLAKMPDDAAELRRLVHYSHSEARASGTTPEERVVIRSALVLAFAHGANKDELARMKTFLTKAPPEMRASVLEALNKPNVNVSRLLNYFQKGPLMVPSNGVEQLQKYNRTEWGQGQRIVNVDKYLDKHEKELGLEGVPQYDQEYQEVRFGAQAVTFYTTEAYVDINNQLRNENNRLGEVSAPVDLTTRAATQFMDRLPDFQGIVRRGGGGFWQDAAREKYIPGQVVTEPTFVSTSPNNGFDGSIQFVIESHHGKEVTELSINSGGDGREVLFPPGAKFEVVSVVNTDTPVTWLDVRQNKMVTEDAMYIILREVD